jgi:hypothetical protein
VDLDHVVRTLGEAGSAVGAVSSAFTVDAPVQQVRSSSPPARGAARGFFCWEARPRRFCWRS